MTTALHRSALAIMMTLMCCISAIAQRRVTPVENPDNKRTPVVTDTPANLPDNIKKRPPTVVEKRDMTGRTVLVDTLSGREYFDTILTKAPRCVYPRWESVSVGINLWDAVARAFGQKYGLASIWGEVSIHNWFKPMVEFGFGNADYIPKQENYHYKSGIAPYFKFGLNYNFLYNSDPRYQVYLGLRYGISSFSYEVTDVTVNQGYWQENETFDIPKQNATVGYFEFLVGLRVMLGANICAGWELKVHSKANHSKCEYGDPWYIPGYGTSGSLFTGSLSISYRLPLHRQTPTSPPPGAEE